MFLKILERAGRVAILRIATTLARARRASPAPIWASPAPIWDDGHKRVLYLRTDRIGDMIMATGLLRAIAQSHPTMSLDVLASPVNAPVLERNPYIRSVLTFDRHRPWTFPATILQIRRARYDAVIDSMVQAPSVTTLLLMVACGARHRIGVSGRGIDSVLTIPVPPGPASGHHIDRSATLATTFGIAPAAIDARPYLPLTALALARADATWVGRGQDAGARFLVNIPVGRRARLWPMDRYVELLQHVRHSMPSLRPILVASPGDSERARRIARATGIDYVPTPTLESAFALVATADCVFTPDTAIVHAASAFQKPVVALYLRGKSVGYGPYRTPGWPLESSNGTLAALPLAPVVAAVDAMLARYGPAISRVRVVVTGGRSSGERVSARR